MMNDMNNDIRQIMSNKLISLQEHSGINKQHLYKYAVYETTKTWKKKTGNKYHVSQAGHT